MERSPFADPPTPTSSNRLLNSTNRNAPTLPTVSPAPSRQPSFSNSRSGSLPVLAPSISDKYSLSPHPEQWGLTNQPEADDYLHNPDPKTDSKGGSIFSRRGFANLGCLLLLGTVIFGLFAGYPLATYFTNKLKQKQQPSGALGVNATGQIPVMPGRIGMIDATTPPEAHTRIAQSTNEEWQLVFSDEFNTDGRSFYPGDDPYWEAVDLHYWQTGNMEWYDPSAVTTKDGNLQITLAEADPATNHNLSYTGGLISSWNKFCFTGGMVVASVQLPGANNVAGMWPAIWAMGNLGRAGYGASLDGLWPYTYDSCDVGTLSNQTLNGLPEAATINGDKNNGYKLSYLPGQRLSRCTCPGESHPGPVHSDGTYVGRSAPEIDMFEAQAIQDGSGFVSQSSQWAPFDYEYAWKNTSDNLIIPNPEITNLNQYTGGVYQQAVSSVTQTNQQCYQMSENPCFAVYGFEYKPGFDNAYISWIANDALAWRLNVAGMGANEETQISARPIPQEPMYLIANLGMSQGFGGFNVSLVTFPAVMLVDYIRVYQPKDAINLGCDPKDFPTQAYINQYPEAYYNPLLTTWVDDYKQTIPKNSFANGGSCS